VLTEENLHLHVPRRCGQSDPPPLRAFFMFADPFTTPSCNCSTPARCVIGRAGDRRMPRDANPGDTRLALDATSTPRLVASHFRRYRNRHGGVAGLPGGGRDVCGHQGHQNVIETLDGKPALAAIEEMVQGLPLLDRQLLATAACRWAGDRPGQRSYGKGIFDPLAGGVRKERRGADRDMIARADLAVPYPGRACRP